MVLRRADVGWIAAVLAAVAVLVAGYLVFGKESLALGFYILLSAGAAVFSYHVHGPGAPRRSAPTDERTATAVWVFVPFPGPALMIVGFPLIGGVVAAAGILTFVGVLTISRWAPEARDAVHSLVYAYLALYVLSIVLFLALTSRAQKAAAPRLERHQ